MLFLNMVMSAGLVPSLVPHENFSLTDHGCHAPVSSLDGPECIRFSIGNVMLKIPAWLKANPDRALNSPPCHDWPSSRGHSLITATSAETPVALVVHTLTSFFLSFFFFKSRGLILERKLSDASTVPGSWHAIHAHHLAKFPRPQRGLQISL